jgi:hypothetical protein
VTSEHAKVDQAGLVERRIERRRQQLQRDWDDARTYVAQKNRWTPLAAVAGMAALGFGLSRAADAPSTPLRRRIGAKRGAFAAIATALGGGLRFVLSPTGRALLTTLRERRRGRYSPGS